MSTRSRLGPGAKLIRTSGSSSNTAGPQGGGNALQGLISTKNRPLSGYMVRHIRTRADGGNARNWVFCMNQLGGVGRRWGANAGPGNRGAPHQQCREAAVASRRAYPLSRPRKGPSPPSPSPSPPSPPEDCFASRYAIHCTQASCAALADYLATLPIPSEVVLLTLDAVTAPLERGIDAGSNGWTNSAYPDGPILQLDDSPGDGQYIVYAGRVGQIFPEFGTLVLQTCVFKPDCEDTPMGKANIPSSASSATCWTVVRNDLTGPGPTVLGTIPDTVGLKFAPIEPV